jgi:hypothetical protein
MKIAKSNLIRLHQNPTAHNRTETENRTEKNLTEIRFQFLWLYG